MKSCNKIPKWPALFIFACFIIMFCFAGATAKTRNPAKNIAAPASRWSMENLAVDRYRNGDPIPEVEDPAAWSELTTGAWCCYENRSENGVTYGKLYNWFAVNDPRGLAPAGWHVASDAEWTELVTALGGEKAAGTRLKSKVLWKAPVVGADNSSGFSALPAGYRSSNGTFSQLGTSAGFWTSTGENSFSAWYRNMFNSYSAVYRTSSSKTQGFSVRCVKD